MNTNRIIAFGDIHGCNHRLKAILKSIDPQPEDTFVFLGDFIDRGPDSKGVIDSVIKLSEEFKTYAILGNHEEMCLEARNGISDHKFWCQFGGNEALASFGVEKASEIPYPYYSFMKNCLPYVELDNFIFVHAGCNPEIPLSANSGSTLRWDKLEEYPELHFSGKTVICGHTVQPQILDLGHFLCLDTGCGIWEGGRLTAMDVVSGKYWQSGGRTLRVTIKERE